MLRLASSKVVPNALRAIACPRILSRSIANASSGADDSSVKTESLIVSQNFSSDAKKEFDRKLVRVLRSEIKLAKLLDFDKGMPQTPPSFPFTIDDIPGKEKIILKREMEGEKIQVSVTPLFKRDAYDEESDDSSTSDSSDDDSNDNNDDSNDNSAEEAADGSSEDSNSTDNQDEEEDEDECSGPDVLEPFLELNVAIEKMATPTPEVFAVKVLASTDAIKVDTMSFEGKLDPNSDDSLTHGPYNVNDDLHRAFSEFMKIRGITITNARFLYKYMLWKAKRDHMLGLEKVKKFVKELIKISA